MGLTGAWKVTMAKRKKLNKRVVVLLVVIGVIVVGGISVWAIKKLPKDPVAYAEHGNEAFANNDFAAADGFYRVAVGEAPKNAEYAYKASQIKLALLRTGNMSDTERRQLFNQAVSLLRQAVRVKPDFADPQRQLCKIYFSAALQSSTNRWPDYITELDKLIKVVPDDAEAYFNRALGKSRLFTIESGTPLRDEVLADFHKALELKSDEANYWQALVEFLLRPDVRMPDEAVKAFEDSIAANPDSVELRAAYAGYLQVNGRNAEALEIIHEAIRRQPDKSVGFLALSRYYEGVGDVAMALKALEDALKVNNSDYRIYEEIARVYKRQGQKDDACNAIRKGLDVIAQKIQEEGTAPAVQTQLTEARYELNYALASLLLEDVNERNMDARSQKLLADANCCLEELLRLSPNNPRRAKIAGIIAIDEGQLNEGVALLEQSMQNSGGAFVDPQAANALINGYLRQRRPGKADEVLEQILHRPEQQSNTALLLASARIKVFAHNFAAAEKPVKEVLRLDANSGDAHALQIILDVLQGHRTIPPHELVPAPEYVSLLLDRAVQMFSSGQQEQAIHLAEYLRDVAPGNSSVPVRLANWYHVTGRDKELAALLGNSTNADPNVMAAIQFENNMATEKDPNKQLAMMLSREEKTEDPLQRELNRSTIYHVFKQNKEFVEHLDAAAKIDPNSPLVIERYFNYALSKPDADLAAQWASRAEASNADGIGGQLYAAQLRLFKQEYAPAIALLSDTLQVHPESKPARTLLGDCYLATNDLERASSSYKSVLTNDPAFARALVGMAKVTDPQKQGNLSEHPMWVERAWQNSDARNDPYIQQEYLKVQENSRDVDIPRLIGQREQRMHDAPGDLDNLYRLGLLYERSSQFPKAQQAYQAFFQQYPNKLIGARAIAGYYNRRGLRSDLMRVLSDALEQTDDKVGAYVLMAEFLETRATDEAQAALDKAIATDPKDARGYAALARLMAHQQKWQPSVAALEKYLELRPDDLGAQRILIRYLVEAGQFADAAATLERCFGKEPSDLEALTIKGLMFLRQRNLAAAQKCFDAVLADNPRYANALLLRAQTFLNLGHPEQAKNDLQVVRQLTSDPDISMDYATVCQRLGDYREAELAYQDVLSHQKDHILAAVSLCRLYLDRQDWPSLEAKFSEFKATFPSSPFFLMMESQMWRARNEKENAIRCLDAAVALAPTSTEAVSNYLLGLVEMGQFEKTVDGYKRYCGDPNLMPAWIGAFPARALVGLNRKAEADRMFAAAVGNDMPVGRRSMVVNQVDEAYGPKVAAEDVDAWTKDQQGKNWQMALLIGNLYYKAREFPQALQFLVKARQLAANPEETATTCILLGMSYYAMGDFRQSEKAYQDVMAVRPDDFQALNNIAYLYANDLKDPSKALPYAQKALDVVPGNANVMDTYGWTLALAEKPAEAERVLLQVLSLGDQPIYHYHLGYVLESGKRWSEASRQYDLGIKLLDQSPDQAAQKLLQEARQRVSSFLKPETQP